MSNDTAITAGRRFPDHPLGREIMRCRPKPVVGYQVDTGEVGCGSMFVITLVCIVLSYLAALLVGAAFAAFGPAVELPARWASFAFILGLIVYSYLIVPRQDYLVLHEKGFRMRLHLTDEAEQSFRF